MFQNRFDQLYLTICKQVGGIEGLLKSFFDFMIRKTDFFYQCDPGDKMGFPPGYNKKLLLGIFQQFQQEHYKRFPKKSVQEFNKKLQAFKDKQKQTQNVNKTKPVQKENKQTQMKNIQSSKVLQTQDKKQQSQSKKAQRSSQLSKKSQKQEKKQTKVNIDLINTYNGGKNQKYSWSQEIRQVQVTLQIDPLIKAKELKVKIQNKFISVKDKQGDILIQGQLYEKINSSQSIWKIQKISGKNYLNFNLEKAEEKIWNTVFVGDPEIDTTKVNNSKPLHDFDEQTQGAIRKIMYEQQRKNQGLPTTDEQKQYEALKQAWNAEGSPFKGTPFDPSKLNLSGFKP